MPHAVDHGSREKAKRRSQKEKRRKPHSLPPSAPTTVVPVSPIKPRAESWTLCGESDDDDDEFVHVAQPVE